MARGDVVSNLDQDVANGAITSLQPASGDEWLITFIITAGSPWRINGPSETQDYRTGLWGGDTTTDTDLAFAALQQMKILMTNSEYIRITNNVGSTQPFGFCAIKTKE